jgi:hypothetical protein
MAACRKPRHPLNDRSPNTRTVVAEKRIKTMAIRLRLVQAVYEISETLLPASGKLGPFEAIVLILFKTDLSPIFGSPRSHLQITAVTMTTLSVTTTPNLTTTFIPPTSCFQDLYATNDGNIYLGPSASATECYPSGWNTNPGFFFSPGLFCPSGYTTDLIGRETVAQATETRVTCCPKYETPT